MSQVLFFLIVYFEYNYIHCDTVFLKQMKIIENWRKNI